MSGKRLNTYKMSAAFIR